VWEDGTGLLESWAVPHIDALAPIDTGSPRGEITWNDAGNLNDADYWYTLTFCTSHQPVEADNCDLWDQ